MKKEATFKKFVALRRFQVGADGITGAVGPGSIIERGDAVYLPVGYAGKISAHLQECPVLPSDRANYEIKNIRHAEYAKGEVQGTIPEPPKSAPAPKATPAPAKPKVVAAPAPREKTPSPAPVKKAPIAFLARGSKKWVALRPCVINDADNPIRIGQGDALYCPEKPGEHFIEKPILQSDAVNMRRRIRHAEFAKGQVQG